jgi:hypothetical protein
LYGPGHDLARCPRRGHAACERILSPVIRCARLAAIRRRAATRHSRDARWHATIRAFNEIDSGGAVALVRNGCVRTGLATPIRVKRT